jgi:sulfur-oxidizing protein SoxZ
MSTPALPPLAQPRVRVPRTAKPGEVIEVRTLIEHRMDTGLRHGGGQAPPRDMLSRLIVRMNGTVIFAAEMRNGTAANPYHVFFARVERTSVLEFTWTDERGRSVSTSQRVAVG